MQQIEFKGDQSPGFAHYVFYIIGLLGFININSMPVAAILVWVAFWCLIGLGSQFFQLACTKFKVVLDDSGIEFTDMFGHTRFSWSEVRVDEITIYKGYKESKLGQAICSHGGDPALAVEKHTGQRGTPTSFLVFRNEANDKRFQLPNLLDHFDYLDLIGILNILVASKSNSKIVQGTLLGYKEPLKLAVDLIKSGNPPASVLEKSIQAQIDNCSRFGFSKLPALESRLKLLEQQGDVQKVVEVRAEIESVKTSFR